MDGMGTQEDTLQCIPKAHLRRQTLLNLASGMSLPLAQACAVISHCSSEFRCLLPTAPHSTLQARDRGKRGGGEPTAPGRNLAPAAPPHEALFVLCPLPCIHRMRTSYIIRAVFSTSYDPSVTCLSSYRALAVPSFQCNQSSG
uniref:Uncharacterized protein n=1 Tax=Odontella aurita TaxID=265563 RepID=A0A7S4HI84_9STRA|mmetsp:Transcript_10382/g.30553  ORF Transcript_10382/g.30553 Transcript_10382/m.30553 type:complete len:143 (+) Transcript_10382:475-903(+)